MLLGYRSVKGRRLPAMVAALGVLLYAHGVAAEGSRKADHAAHRQAAAMPAGQPEWADIKLPDLELQDQEGQSVRFRSDVIQDRIVVMSFIYTRCTTVCPVTTALLAQVQEALGGRLGQEVWLVSLTVDPAVDTPQRLKEYGQRFGARPGWIWLTGYRPTVNRVLKALGVYAANFTEHPPMLLIGDGRRGVWTRLYGLISPEQILKQVERLTVARQAASLNRQE